MAGEVFSGELFQIIAAGHSMDDTSCEISGPEGVLEAWNCLFVFIRAHHKGNVYGLDLELFKSGALLQIQALLVGLNAFSIMRQPQSLGS